MWLIFAILSGLAYTVQGLITRHILRGQKDAWAFSFYFSGVGALVALPFAVLNFQAAQTFIPWLILSLTGLLIVAQNLLNFKATNFLEASVQGALTKFRLVWVFIFGVIILDEVFSPTKLIGTLLTILAGLVIIKKFKKPDSLQGIIWVMLATIVYAIVIVFYKFLFANFNSASLTFFIFLIPAIINLLAMPNSLSRIKKMYEESGRTVMTACGFGGLANLAMNQALAIGEASRALVIIEAFLVMTLVGEYFFLREKGNLLAKLAAVFLATAGAILIRI